MNSTLTPTLHSHLVKFGKEHQCSSVGGRLHSSIWQILMFHVFFSITTCSWAKTMCNFAFLACTECGSNLGTSSSMSTKQLFIVRDAMPYGRGSLSLSCHYALKSLQLSCLSTKEGLWYGYSNTGCLRSLSCCFRLSHQADGEQKDESLPCSFHSIFMAGEKAGASASQMPVDLSALF